MRVIFNYLIYHFDTIFVPQFLKQFCINNNFLPIQFYADAVKMWVFEELIEGKKLTEIINETHENVKYLKGKDYIHLH